MKASTLAQATLLILLLPFLSKAQINSESTLKSSFGMYEALARGNNQNLFFSPYSINAALSMAYIGAKGKTQLEFENVLNLSNDRTSNEQSLESYIKGMMNIKNVELKVANHLWVEQSMALLPNFSRKINQLNGEITSIDFSNQPSRSAKIINKKIAQQTNGKVKNLLPEGTLNELTRFVMTNAIYFMGNWEDHFDSDETTTDDFWVSKDSKSNVKLMNKQHFYNHAAIDDFQVIELPYKGKAMSMIVILPNNKDGLEKLERHINASTFQKWLNKLERKEVQLSFPRFKMSSNISLKPYLTSLGLTTAFTEHDANFSGMMQEAVFLSSAIHKSSVEVNEKGTEASVATAIIGMSKGVRIKMPVFKANHPFIYIIKENIGDQILFMGRFADPRIVETKLSSPSLAANTVNDDKFIHVVSKGETLFKIAKLYSVDVKNIRKSNLLAKDVIFVGQKLLIQTQFQAKGNAPVTEYLFLGKKRKNIPTINFTSPPPSVVNKQNENVHIVEKGETLYRISKKYGVSVDELKANNNLTSSALSLGQELKIKTSDEDNTEHIKVETVQNQGFVDFSAKPETTIYKVKSGNSLSQIAKQFNQVSVAEIKKWNNLKGDLIFVGQELKIYNK